jgi:hypothetical protein
MRARSATERIRERVISLELLQTHGARAIVVTIDQQASN